MFGIFRRLFNRRVSTVRRCPECGFTGSPKQFERVKMTTTDSYSSSGSAGSDGSAGSSGAPSTPTPTPAPPPVTSDPNSSGSDGSAGSSGV